MGSSLSTASLMPPLSTPPTSLSSSASSSSASSHGSFTANNAADAGFRRDHNGRFAGFYSTTAGGSHLPRSLSGKRVAASTHSSRHACSYGCERYGCNCTDKGLGTDYYGCCECERAEAMLNSPYDCCDYDYHYSKGNGQHDNSLASAFASFVKRSQRNLDDRNQRSQSKFYENQTKARRSRANTHCVANIVAHGRNALSSANECGRNSGFNSSATSARSADSSNGDYRRRSALLRNISQRFSVDDKTTLREIRTSMRQRAAADDGPRNANDTHSTLKTAATSKDDEYGSATVLTAALTSLCVESGALRTEVSAGLSSSIFDTKTLETYKYERPLTPATNDIDAARYGSHSVVDTRCAKTLKKGAQSGFFATQYAKLAEKRISIGRWANFTSSGQQKSAAPVPRTAAALSKTKNRSKTTTSLLGNFANRQQQELSQLNAKPTTKRSMTRSDRAIRHQRNSLMSVLPTSFSSYRLAGLLDSASGRLVARDKTSTADPEESQVPSQDEKRPLSWTGSLANSILSGSGAALSRPSSSYSTAGWDSGFYVDANSNNCVGNGMIHYDGRLKRSTLTTATSGYGSFSEQLVSPEPDYGSPAGNSNTEEHQNSDECCDTVPAEACTSHQRRQSAAMSKSAYSGFDSTKSIHDQAHYNSSKSASRDNNRHSLPSISRGAITFTSSFEKEMRTVPLANGLFIDANSQPPKSDKNNNKINCYDKNVDGGEKTIIQASTSELLQALSIFISKKFCGMRHFDASHVVTWMRAVDQALIVQGWQYIAFINPANLVFVYMLIREHFRAQNDSLQQIVTVDEIQALVLTCLYISYSYMGNEISYPLKPFIAETADRVEFWQRCVSIVNAHSASMLRLNSSSAFFLDVFTELKTIYSAE